MINIKSTLSDGAAQKFLENLSQELLSEDAPKITIEIDGSIERPRIVMDITDLNYFIFDWLRTTKHRKSK